MKVSIKAFAAVALVTLLVPAAAGAKEAELNGPAALKGAGFFGGEVAMRATDAQRPLVVAGRGGYVGFLDLGGDLKVRCQGKGRIRAHETKQGTVYLCLGRGGRATALGGHFRLRGFARSYGITVPEGATATLHGRFVVCARGGCTGPVQGGRGAGSAKPADDEQADEPIPSTDELAAILADQ